MSQRLTSNQPRKSEPQDMTVTPMIVVFGRLHERGGVVMCGDPTGVKLMVFASTTSPCGMRMSLFSTS